ncbi:MAG: TIGR02452 family protein [Oceanobacillus sp.]|nr:TIGR02452 family protein [Oceanobacillus sp.]
MSRKDLVTCFANTMEIANGETLSNYTKAAYDGTVVYEEGFNSNKNNLFKNGELIVIEATTFDAAKKYAKGRKTAVLNFANPVTPGGGVQNGAMAQEECLCRSSNLYPCLCSAEAREKYYDYHKNLNNNTASDRVIYTRDICVFKTDDEIPQLMDQEEWFNVDVITCAAPYQGGIKKLKNDDLKPLFKSRIKNIFEAALDNGVDVLVLGAFGCGAFHNPPMLVADAFKEVIEEEHYLSKFELIVFAIKQSKDKKNYTVFNNCFNGIKNEEAESDKTYVKYYEMKIADLSDDELKAILDIRKKYSEEERVELIKGLYFISLADGEYSDFEREMVESTACTLGYNTKKLESITANISIDSDPKYLFSDVKPKFKETLFSEMISLTYIKGFQTADEDNCLKNVAKALSISDKKAESMMENIYLSSQGITQESALKSTLAKVGIGVTAVAASAALFAVTAGAAAPLIGGLLGSSAGLTGAAATAHGLALLGGGTLAMHGGGVAAGTAFIVKAGGIIGASTGAFGTSVFGNIAAAQDKKKLKAMVIKQMKEDKTLQEITDNLVTALELQEKRIEELEKANASQRDISHAKSAYDNLVAQKAEIKDLYEKENAKK